MNLAITTTSTSTWKAVKRHYFIAIAGSLLAITALAGGAAISGLDFAGGPSGPAPAKSNFRITPGMVAPSPAMTYYLVGSEEERASVVAQAMWQVEDNAEYYPGKHWNFEVLVAGTVEAETDAMASLRETNARWTAAGATGLEVIDMRQPELRHSLNLQRIPIYIYLVESQMRADDIIASVESDRNESETPRPRVFAFKATTPEEEARVAEFVASWEGRNVQVLDYRPSASDE